MKKLVILGAGGHGKVVADIAVKNGYEEIVFLDDNETSCAGFSVVGKIEDAAKIKGDKFVAIGDANLRQKLMEKIKTVTLIHLRATISRRVTIGEGTVVMAGAVINSDTKIGKGCIINTSASVDHDCTLDDFVHISVGAHLAGNVRVATRTWLGVSASVINNIAICKECMIGAGAVVVKDINKSGTYVGVPARLLTR